MGIGICLKSKVELQGFNPETSPYSNGSYMVFNDNYVYTYENKLKNNRTDYGFRFLAGEIIAVELDKESNTLKFRN